MCLIRILRLDTNLKVGTQDKVLQTVDLVLIFWWSKTDQGDLHNLAVTNEGD